MRNRMKKYCLLFIFITWASMLGAQSIDISTVKEAECFNDGEIVLKLKDLAWKDATTINVEILKKNEDGSYSDYRSYDKDMLILEDNGTFLLEAYQSGDYKLKYTVADGTQVYSGELPLSVGGNYKEMLSLQTGGGLETEHGTRTTLTCSETGRIQLEIIDGKMPYTVEILKDGEPLRTEIINNRMHGGTDPSLEDYQDYYDFADLPQGSYSFTITDGCGYEQPLSYPMFVNEVGLQDIPDFASFDTIENNQAKFEFKGDFFNDIKYNNTPEKYLESRYKVDDGSWSEWGAYTGTASEPASDIEDIYDKTFTFELREKGCEDAFTRSEVMIPYTPPSPCVGSLNTSVTLKEKPGEPKPVPCKCKKEEKKIEYDKYEVSLSFSFCNPKGLPLTYSIKNITTGKERDIEDYQFNAENSRSGSHLYEGLLGQQDTIGHTLKIKLSDQDTVYLEQEMEIPPPLPIVPTPPTPMKWSAEKNVSAIGCDNPKGTVGLVLNCDSVPVGTVIKLTKAPLNTITFEATYTYGASDPWTITSNAAPKTELNNCKSKLIMSFDPFPFGVYEWNIKDDSGRDTIVTIDIKENFRRYEVSETISFTNARNCSGMVYYPKGQIKSRSYFNPLDIVDEPTKFRVKTGNATGYKINEGKTTWGYTNRDSLLITKPGNYEIELFYNPSGGTPLPNIKDCSTNSQVITYKVQNVSFDDYYGYLCADDINSTVEGSVCITVKEGTGIAPYQFYLYSGNNNRGELLGTNDKGVFEHIESGSTRFYVRVEDACRVKFGVPVPLTRIITSSTILGDPEVCKGSPAHFSGKVIGGKQSATYEWRGKNGIVSTGRDLTTPAVVDEATYSLEIKGLGCKVFNEITVKAKDEIHIYYEDVICKGRDYDGGSEYGNPIATADFIVGIYEFDSGKHTAVNGGCDSTAHLKLHIIEEDYIIEEKDTICDNEFPFFWNDTIFESGTPSGAYKIERMRNTCRYYEQLSLKVNPTYNDTLEVQICEGESQLFNGVLYNENGYYTNSFKNSNTCDSLSTMHLIVNPVGATVLMDTIYLGEEYQKYNFYYPQQYEVGKLENKVNLRNQYGCDSLVSLNLSVLPVEVIIPEGFSPNGDGVNDYFSIKNIELYPKNRLMIVNRWGNKLYEGKPYMNEWDGRNHEKGGLGGDILPTGTYFYILDLGYDKEVRKGFIYLSQ